MRCPPAHQRRPGAIAPLTAALCLILFGMVAFGVDIAWMVVTETEVQNTADAAALAGANELMDPLVQHQLPGLTTDEKTAILNAALTRARNTAKTYAGYNGAGEKTALHLRDQDIEFGFVDSQQGYTAYASGGPFPNSIKVTVRRDAQANSPLPLFFARVLGVADQKLEASARATLYTGVFESLSANAPRNVGLLPMTFDVDDWDEFLRTGKDRRGNKATDEAGVPQIKVYPVFQDEGNFGQLALDDEHAGSSEIRDWIRSGINKDDIRTLIARGLLPLGARTQPAWDWLGDPGIHADTVMAVNDHAGQVYVLPLFKSYLNDAHDYEAGVEQGSQYSYNIVRFVAIKIMPTDRDNRQIIVQPAAYVDPGIVFAPGSVAPAGSVSRFESIFTTPKLTR